MNKITAADIEADVLSALKGSDLEGWTVRADAMTVAMANGEISAEEFNDHILSRISSLNENDGWYAVQLARIALGYSAQKRSSGDF